MKDNLAKSKDSLRMIHEVTRIISPVYLVGGSVRDLLMDKEPSDYDFTTSLTPDEIEQLVRGAGKKAFVTGKRYGTVGMKIDGHLVEITTFRSEKYLPGLRKPTVEFVNNINHDLSRRDFTINAIAMKPDGKLVDPFGGQRDISSRLIRAVGKAGERFSEDPLRMLRAARFASQLNFSLEAETEVRILKRSANILDVSKERWVQELDKLLLSDQPQLGLDILARTRLLNFILPELAIQVGYDQDSPYHELDLWEHTLKTVKLSEKGLDLRWAALLHDIGKPYVRTVNKRGYSNYVDHDKVSAEIVNKIGKYLRWSNERLSSVEKLVREHMHPDSPLKNADNAARFADG